jgi:fructoselysine and glucoselysine-specific PTS system IIA component
MKTKTRKFLIATHGALAGGFRSSLELIAGASDAVYILQAYLDERIPFEEELDSLFRQTGEDEEWVVFSDLLGGSITNQLVRAASRVAAGATATASAGTGTSTGAGAGAGTNIHIVAGFNLPLLIEVVLSDPETPIEEVLEQAIARAREQLVYVNKLITPKNNESENA